MKRLMPQDCRSIRKKGRSAGYGLALRFPPQPFHSVKVNGVKPSPRLKKFTLPSSVQSIKLVNAKFFCTL
jgi:hypothetical protein